MSANFDRVARVYRRLEYASFGRALERCRFTFLPQLGGVKRVLALGDGDGRFLQRMLFCNENVRAEAVDRSSAMLRLLMARCGTERVTAHCVDALEFAPEGEYDCVATHFFLDCLTTEECVVLAERVVRHLGAGGVWVVSEFCVPRGWMRWPAVVVIRGLYAGFRLMAGLRTRRLPAYAQALRGEGLEMVEERFFLGGLLVAQVWGRVSFDENARRG